MAGIFVTKGMTIGIPPGGLELSLGGNGEPSANLTIHVHFDVCPTWLMLAIRHLADASVREGERNAAWAGSDESQKAASLEREFESSMQAVMAAAIALDAFYACVRKKMDVPEELSNRWRENRTSRPVQISEVMRIAFGLRGAGFQALRDNLREIYRFRDAAIHPAGDIEAPILHSELDVGVEWRFAYFRYANANRVVTTTLRMLSEMVTRGIPRNDAVKDYASVIRERLAGMGVITNITDQPTKTDTENVEA